MWKRVFLLWDWDGILGSLLHGADLAEFFERILVLGSGVLIGGLEGFLFGEVVQIKISYYWMKHLSTMLLTY